MRWSTSTASQGRPAPGSGAGRELGATPDTLQRRFLNSPGEIINRGSEIVVRLDRKTYNPVLRQADLPVTAVPWWGGRTLRFEYE